MIDMAQAIAWIKVGNFYRVYGKGGVLLGEYTRERLIELLQAVSNEGVSPCGWKH